MKKILLFILIIILITGCSVSKDNKILSKVEKTYSKYKGYRGRTIVMIHQRDSFSTYIIDESYIDLDNYNLEIIHPPESKGITINKSGEEITINHPNIDQSITINASKSLKKQPFFGEFFKSVNKSFFQEREKIEGEKYLIFDFELNNKNKYMNIAKIWINEKTFYPYKLNIYDDSDNIVIEILYEDFIYLN